MCLTTNMRPDAGSVYVVQRLETLIFLAPRELEREWVDPARGSI